MAITSGSRYENSIVDVFRKKEGGTTYPVVLYSFDSLENISFYYYRYQLGQTLQGISQKLLGTPKLWWAIEYNPELTDIFHITDGTLLRIPSV